MNRRLTLKSETLAELTAGELGAVAGGATTDCFTGMYPSINMPCGNTYQFCIQYAVTKECPTVYCTGTTSV